jgi:D-alanyl-D-alanine carboxypeptidase (penicillin-binding protein 5/6)
MKKRMLAVCAVLLLVCMVPIVGVQAAEPLLSLAPALNLPCRNALLLSMDTGEVLYEMGADDEVPIASITKVMTLLLTLEAVESGKVSMSDIVPISEHAYNMGGSQIWLEPGEIFTLDELVKAICVCSANDAAVAVAEFIGGSEPVFAQMMNDRAAELGMTHTNFVNACGLDEEGHYSSARDVAIMSMELLKHPKILEYSGIWMDTLRGGETQITNTNKLLKSYAGITGLKTGTTNGAGVCIAASAVRDDMGLLAVVLGSPSSKERFEAATTLLDYGFSTFETADFPQIVQGTDTLAVRRGVAEQVGLTYSVPDKLLLKKGEGDNLTAQLTLPEALEAPVAQGTQVGTVRLTAGEEVLGEYPVLTSGSVAQMDLSAALEFLTKALFTL